MFDKDPCDPELRIYRTGDLATRDGNGCITLAGRRDFQVKVRGFRIEVAEVEVALMDIEGINDAVVIGRAGDDGDMRLIGYFVARPGVNIELPRIRQELASRLPDYMVPSQMVRLDALPLTAAGKTDRKRLPDPLSSRPAMNAAYQSARTPTEKAVTSIWRRVLGVNQVGVEDSFLELGGDSIRAMRFIGEAADSFSLDLSIQDQLTTHTPRQIARMIDDKLEVFPH